jgi:peptidyl-prolyl cis-trans isomerase B (cyclophilin B)
VTSVLAILQKNSSLCLLICLSIISACSNKEQRATGQSDQAKIVKEKETTNNITHHQKLNSSNAVEFFLDYGAAHSESTVLVSTDFGDIKIQLFDDTPMHRSNFIFLAKRGYFNTTWFHRVSEGHVIQAGNSDSETTAKKRKEIGSYSLPSEMTDHNYHEYGAVAAARSYKRNPNKRSNPFEFYISLGQKFSVGQLKAMEDKYELEFTNEQMKLYSTKGGSPHLDHEHTVFGRVIEGMDVVERISRVEVDSGEWPLSNVPITVKVLP